MTTDSQARPPQRLTHLIATFAAGLAVLASSPAAAIDLLKDRPAFALGDQQPERAAECGELRDMISGMVVPDFRIDLAVRGTLTAVETDGALWYLIMCAARPTFR